MGPAGRTGDHPPGAAARPSRAGKTLKRGLSWKDLGRQGGQAPAGCRERIIQQTDKDIFTISLQLHCKSQTSLGHFVKLSPGQFDSLASTSEYGHSFRYISQNWNPCVLKAS